MRKQEAIKLAKNFRLGNRHRKANLLKDYNIRAATSPNTGRLKMGIRIDVENNPRDYIAALDDDGKLVFFSGNPVRRIPAVKLWDTPKATKKESVNEEAPDSVSEDTVPRKLKGAPTSFSPAKYYYSLFPNRQDAVKALKKAGFEGFGDLTISQKDGTIKVNPNATAYRKQGIKLTDYKGQHKYVMSILDPKRRFRESAETSESLINIKNEIETIKQRIEKASALKKKQEVAKLKASLKSLEKKKKRFIRVESVIKEKYDDNFYQGFAAALVKKYGKKIKRKLIDNEYPSGNDFSVDKNKLDQELSKLKATVMESTGIIDRHMAVLKTIFKEESNDLLEQFNIEYGFDINDVNVVEIKQRFDSFKKCKISEATQYQLVAQKANDGGEVKSKFYDDENDLAELQKKIEDSENYESSAIVKRIVGTDEDEDEKETTDELQNEMVLHENFLKTLDSMVKRVKSGDKKLTSSIIDLIKKKANPMAIRKQFKGLSRAGKDYVMGVLSTSDDPLLQKGKVLNAIVNEDFEQQKDFRIDGRSKQFKEKLTKLQYAKEGLIDEAIVRKQKKINPKLWVFVDFKDQHTDHPFSAKNLKFTKGRGFIFHRDVSGDPLKKLPIPSGFTSGAWVRLGVLPGLIIRDSAKKSASKGLLSKFLSAVPGYTTEANVVQTIQSLTKNMKGHQKAIVWVIAGGVALVAKSFDKGLYIKKQNMDGNKSFELGLGYKNQDFAESTEINEVLPAAAAIGAAKVIGGGIATGAAAAAAREIAKKKEREKRIKRWQMRLRHARKQLSQAKTPSDKAAAKTRIQNLQMRLDEID